MKQLLLSVVFLAAYAHAAKVSEVKVKALDGFGGNAGSVASRCQTKAGTEYDPVTVTRDVNALKSSGEFEEITADAVKVFSGDVDVVFYVKRKVRFQAPLKVDGNEFFSESKVAKEAGLSDGALYGESDLAEAAAKVRKAYRKKNFADAKVSPVVEVVSANDAKITFVVDEGVRRKVRDFVFDGAEHAVKPGFLRAIAPNPEYDNGEFPVAELREAISDYPWWNPVGWFADEPVSRDQLAQCCDKLAEVYRNHGYLDVAVTGPEEVEVEGDLKDIVFKVKEGPQYKVGRVSVAGLTRYREDAVIAASDVPAEGVVAGRKMLDDAVQRVKVAVGSGDSGLADTRVEARHIPSEVDPSTVDIVFQVTEGAPVRINEVKIRGNDYTKDKVIRREISLGPGDRMLEDHAERSKKRLENLDYFSRVGYYLEKTDLGKDENGAEYRNLVYEVEEKNTGSFRVGIGASAVDSVYVSAEVNQNTFDLVAPAGRRAAPTSPGARATRAPSSASSSPTSSGGCLSSRSTPTGACAGTTSTTSTAAARTPRSPIRSSSGRPRTRSAGSESGSPASTSSSTTWSGATSTTSPARGSRSGRRSASTTMQSNRWCTSSGRATPATASACRRPATAPASSPTSRRPATTSTGGSASATAATSRPGSVTAMCSWSACGRRRSTRSATRCRSTTACSSAAPSPSAASSIAMSRRW